MKSVLKRITEFFYIRAELEEANRYIDFAEEEIDFLRKSLMERFEENGRLTQQNEKLLGDVDALRESKKKVQDYILSHGSGSAERGGVDGGMCQQEGAYQCHTKRVKKEAHTPL